MRAGEAMDRANKAGRTAYLRYKGGVLGEEPLDDRSAGDPLAVVIGTMQLPRGVEEAVVGMEVGETMTDFELCYELGRRLRPEVWEDFASAKEFMDCLLYTSRCV